MDIMGVPPDFLRGRNICIKFNLGKCTFTTAPHESPDKTGSQLKHICGGCAFLKKPDDVSHMMMNCPAKDSKTQSFH